MCPTTPTSTAVRVDPQTDSPSPALTLIDDIQGVRAQLLTDRGCHPTRCSPDAVRMPVDAAYDLHPATLWTRQLNTVIVRNATGQVQTEITNREQATVPQGTYTVELCSLGLKVYLRVHGAITIRTDANRGRVIDCTDATTVRLGLRSFHESPAATVTTTDQPRDIMRALSCLGSALKTTSCERSFPSLRGHPPLLEQGSTFAAPNGLERTTDTERVRIEIPPTLESIYPIAPLAYYLDAVVQPGETPCLITGDTRHTLDGPEGLESAVGQLLAHVFTLDCITRTEGFYPVTLKERIALEQRLADHVDTEIDFTALYDRPLIEQIQIYLSLPFDLVNDLTPRWPLTADVKPDPEYLPMLPFVVSKLGLVRCFHTDRSESTDSTKPATPAIDEFCRIASDNDSTALVRNSPTPTSHAALMRASDDTDELSQDIYSPPETNSITQCWLNDGYPMRGAKPTMAAWKRHLDANPTETVDVAVVSNSAEMREETDVADLYGLRDQIAFDITIHEDLTQSALREVFTGDHDLIHYVGHVNADGLQCSDGWLDAHTLDMVTTRAVVLNGCRSHEQGLALIEAGAIGGLCTFTNVTNTLATNIGRTIARLLNAGFSLGGALDLISEASLTGRRYLIVGDPGLAIADSTGNTPMMTEIVSYSSTDPEPTYRINIYTYPSNRSPLGGAYVPYIGTRTTYSINSGHVAEMTVSKADLEAFLQQGYFPVRIDDEFYWSTYLSLDAVYS